MPWGPSVCISDPSHTHTETQDHEMRLPVYEERGLLTPDQSFRVLLGDKWGVELAANGNGKVCSVNTFFKI